MLDHDSFMDFVRREAAAGREYRTRTEGVPFSFKLAGRGLSFVPSSTLHARYESPKHIRLFLEAFLEGSRTSTRVGPTRNSSYLFALAEAWLSACGAAPFELPEIVIPEGITEGCVIERVVRQYERSSRARDACIALHGTRCCICEIDFSERYGPAAKGIIHVHHLHPLAVAQGARVVDPLIDLRPVCPNCHAVIHHEGACRSIEEVKAMLRAVS